MSSQRIDSSKLFARSYWTSFRLLLELAFTSGRDRRAADKGKLVVIAHLSLTMPVTGASLEALGRVLCQYSALGARTGRALQNGLHAGRKQSIGHPFSSHQKFGRAMLPDNESRDGEFHKLFRLATDKKAADHEGCSYSMSRASSSHH